VSHRQRLHPAGAPKSGAGINRKSAEKRVACDFPENFDDIELRKIVVRGTNIGPSPKA
jgi:hypothetical protein